MTILSAYAGDGITISSINDVIAVSHVVFVVLGRNYAPIVLTNSAVPPSRYSAGMPSVHARRMPPLCR